MKQAYSISLSYCDNCNHPHFSMEDENGEIFGEAVLSETQCRNIIDFLQRSLYQSAVEKDK